MTFPQRSILPLLALAFCDPAFAQEPQDTTSTDSVYKIEAITVTVARPMTAAGGASALVARLDSIRSGPAVTLDETLRRLPFIQIRANSRGEAQPQLRGMESRRVAVLVDGIPLTLGWDARTDLSIVPLSAAREITLIRGLSSVLHGPNSLGGVVQIAIAEGADRGMASEPFRFGASLDGEGSTEASGGLSALTRVGAGDLLLKAGGAYRNRNDFPLPDGVVSATPGSGDDRVNSDFQQASGYLVGRYQAAGGSWAAISSFGFDSEKGVPPELHVQDPRLWRYPKASRWITAISTGTGWRRTPLGEGDLEASIGLDFGSTDIDSYATLAFDSVVERERGDDRTLSLRLVGDHNLGPGVLRSAFTIAETRHVETLVPGDRSVFKQRLWSLGLEAEQPLAVEPGGAARARVSAGVSVDRASTPETGGREPRDPIWEWGARAGGTLALGDGSVLLNGGLSRRVRFPALRELYSGALGRFLVNPGLDPEKLVVAELGVTGRIGDVELQTVGFHQRLTDAIVRVGLGDGRFQRQNRDELLVTGVEVLTNVTWRRIYLAADVTLQSTELNDPSSPDDGRRPEYQPWIAGSASLSGPLPLGVRGSARTHHLGRQFCVNPDTGADDRLDAETWLDLEISRAFRIGGAGRSLEAALALDNVTDADVFDQCGLPQPGRLLRIGIRIR